MTTDSQRFLQEEAARLATENAELRQDLAALRQSVRALSSLYYVSLNITAQTDIARLLGEILDTSLAVLKATDGTLMLADDETGDLVFSVVRGGQADRLAGYRLPQGQGIAGWVAANRQPQIVRDVRLDPRFFPGVDDALHFTTRSMVCVPVQLDDGRLLGVIEIINKIADDEFGQADLELVLIVAQLAATAMRRAERAIEAAQREERRAASAPPPSASPSPN
jgi:GAF domain-containing protein